MDQRYGEPIAVGQLSPAPYLPPASYSSYPDSRTGSVYGVQSGTTPYDSISYFTPIPFPLSAQPHSDQRSDPNIHGKSRSPSNVTRVGDTPDINHATSSPRPSISPTPFPAANTPRVVVHQDIADGGEVELPPQYSSSRPPLVFMQPSDTQPSQGNHGVGG